MMKSNTVYDHLHWPYHLTLSFLFDNLRNESKQSGYVLVFFFQGDDILSEGIAINQPRSIETQYN